MSNATGAQPMASPAEKRAPRHAQMHGLMALATFFWSANIVAVKEAARWFTPLALVQLRILGAAVLLAALFPLWLRKKRAGTAWPGWRTLVPLALTGVVFNQLCFIGGVARTSVAHTGLLTALGPVLVLVLACLMRLEALTVAKFAGMLVSFAGVAVLTVQRPGQGNAAHWVGDLLILGASVVFASYTIQVKKVAHLYDSITLNTLMYTVGALIMLPVGGASVLGMRWDAVTTEALWALGYIVVFGSVIPYSIYAYAMTELAASRVAAFGYLQPVIASTLAIWLLGEKPTWRVATGGALILAGVYFTERERGEERDAAAQDRALETVASAHPQPDGEFKRPTAS